MKQSCRVCAILIIMITIVVGFISQQSIPIYAQENDDDSQLGTNTEYQIFIPLVIVQQQVDDVGVFQTFELDSELQELTPVDAQAAGVCIRTPIGPGWVNWTMSNPGQSGYKYSVKPETSIPLVWAQAPSQGIDGIYKASWGSCIAFKVPDSCTITVNADGSVGTCCNAALAAAGYIPKWTNTCSSSSPESGWPDNPLQ